MKYPAFSPPLQPCLIKGEGEKPSTFGKIILGQETI
jgi:hypothetical protein